MAPEGKHCLHAYLPATEPYHLWRGLKKGRWVGNGTTGTAVAAVMCIFPSTFRRVYLASCRCWSNMRLGFGMEVLSVLSYSS